MTEMKHLTEPNLFYGWLAERDRNIIKVAHQLEWSIAQHPGTKVITLSSPLYPHIKLELDPTGGLTDEVARRHVEALKRYSLQETWERVVQEVPKAAHTVPSTLTQPIGVAVVTRAPWQAQRHGGLRDSLHVNQLTLADGSVAYECMTCGLRNPDPRSVTAHSIGAHGAKEKKVKKAQKAARAPKAKGPKPTPTGVELVAVQVAEDRWEITCPHCGHISFGTQAGFARRGAWRHDRVHARGPQGKKGVEAKRWAPVEETAQRRITHQAGYRFANGKLSERAIERRWSDGSVDWACAHTDCTYHRPDGPRGVTAHYGGTHQRAGTGAVQQKMLSLQDAPARVIPELRNAVKKAKAQSAQVVGLPRVEQNGLVLAAVDTLLSHIAGLDKQLDAKGREIAILQAEVTACHEQYAELQGDWQRMGELFSTRFPQG